MLTRALGPRCRLGDSSACLSPPPDRDTTELRGPHEPATTHRSDRIHWMDGTHRGSADRSGMPDTCTGMPSPVPDVDFTVRSAALAREFTDGHHLPGDIRELVANAIAMHYTPGVGLEPMPRPTSCLPAQLSMCSASAATRYPMPSAGASSKSTRGWASSGSSPGFSEPRPSKSLVAEAGSCPASP